MMNWRLQTACLALLFAPLCLGQKLRALSQQEVKDLVPGRKAGTGDRPNEFVTYLACDYDLSDDVNPKKVDLSDVVDAIIPAYNGLIEDFDDPFQRRIQSATVIFNDVIDDRQLQEDASALQEGHGRKLFVTVTVIEIFGFCLGCVRNLQLTNQVSGRRLATGGGMRDPIYDGEDMNPDDPKGPQVPTDGEDMNPDDPKGPQAPTDGEDSNPDGPEGAQAPTEEEFLNAYSDFWRSVRDENNLVLDVVGLEEIQRPRLEGKGTGGKGKGGKSSKKSGKGKGGKGNGAESGKGKGGKGNSAESGKGKGGKGGKRE